MPEGTTSTPAAVDVPGLLAAVTEEARAGGSAWFPELRTDSVTVRLRHTMERPRCRLFRLDLDDGRTTRPVVVKARHSETRLRRPDRFEDRPVLAPVRLLSDEDTGRREYDGLVLLRDALSPHLGSQRFGVLRPLAWLPEHAAIVTDFVEQPTLRTRLLSTSRLRPWRAEPLPETPWHNAGAALRRFHDQPTSLSLPPRAETAAEVGKLYRQFAAFLVERTGPLPLLAELEACGAELAARSLPADLPLGTGHGDFVANNLFTGPAGEITVFDPLPMWRVPRHQDLATLLVGLRVLPVQAGSRGLAFPGSALDRYESALVAGYAGHGSGDDAVAGSALAAFQLLVLLDKWSSLVSRGPRTGRLQHLRRARVWTFSRHYHAEARRLLGRLVGPSSA
jgi:hypothetical protein